MSYQAHETAVIDAGCEIGEGTHIWHFSHIMTGCVIGRACNIGQNVVVSPGVVLGNNVKVQNNVSIYTGVICSENPERSFAPLSASTTYHISVLPIELCLFFAKSSAGCT